MTNSPFYPSFHQMHVHTYGLRMHCTFTAKAPGVPNAGPHIYVVRTADLRVRRKFHS